MDGKLDVGLFAAMDRHHASAAGRCREASVTKTGAGICDFADRRVTRLKRAKGEKSFLDGVHIGLSELRNSATG